MGAKDLNTTLKGAVHNSLDRAVYTKVHPLHHAGKDTMAVAEVILISIDTNHERRTRRLALGFKVFGNGFEIADTQRTCYVVDDPGTLRKHGFSCSLAFGNITEGARISPQKTYVGLLACFLGVLGISPMHPIAVACFKFIEDRDFYSEHYANLVITVMGGHH